jgi:hypothetical protein
VKIVVGLVLIYAGYKVAENGPPARSHSSQNYFAGVLMMWGIGFILIGLI